MFIPEAEAMLFLKELLLGRFKQRKDEERGPKFPSIFTCQTSLISCFSSVFTVSVMACLPALSHVPFVFLFWNKSNFILNFKGLVLECFEWIQFIKIQRNLGCTPWSKKREKKKSVDLFKCVRLTKSPLIHNYALTGKYLDHTTWKLDWFKTPVDGHDTKANKVEFFLLGAGKNSQFTIMMKCSIYAFAIFF
jgi:hypothetical protein